MKSLDDPVARRKEIFASATGDPQVLSAMCVKAEQRFDKMLEAMRDHGFVYLQDENAQIIGWLIDPKGGYGTWMVEQLPEEPPNKAWDHTHIDITTGEWPE